LSMSGFGDSTGGIVSVRARMSRGATALAGEAGRRAGNSLFLSE
jgi:hypothetical protein